MDLKELQKANLEHSILMEMQKNRISNDSIRAVNNAENYIARLVNAPFKRSKYEFTEEDNKNIKKLLDQVFNGIETVLKHENELIGKYELEYSIKLNNDVSRTRLKPKTTTFQLAKDTIKPNDILSKKTKLELLVQRNHLENLIKRKMRGLIKNGVKPVAVAEELNKTLKSRNGTLLTIARTSTSATVNQTNIKALALAGVKEFIYNATLDSRTSDECRAANGSIHPAKTALLEVPKHPNCRCNMIPVYPENGVKLDDYKDLIDDIKATKELSSDVSERFTIAKNEKITIERQRKLEELS